MYISVLDSSQRVRPECSLHPLKMTCMAAVSRPHVGLLQSFQLFSFDGGVRVMSGVYILPPRTQAQQGVK